MSPQSAATSDGRVGSADVSAHEYVDAFDRRLEERLDAIRRDVVRTIRIWLTLSQIVVVESVAVVLLVRR
jgi:hypothetical protein